MTPMNSPQGAPQKKSTAAVLLIVLGAGGLAMLCCIGMLAAIAIPNFIKFGSKSKQSEAKSNLKSVYTAERSYFSEKDTYSDDATKIGFSPEKKNRYMYVLSASNVIDADLAVAPGFMRAAYLAAIPAGLVTQAGVHGTCPDDCSITSVAVGNIDNDSTLDVWSVSTADRTIGKEKVPAGQPFNHVSDVDE